LEGVSLFVSFYFQLLIFFPCGSTRERTFKKIAA
jgi:hypothetical protein